MDTLEDRVRVLEKRLWSYRILNLVVAAVVLAWLGLVFFSMVHREQIIDSVAPILRTKRLEIVDDPASRPVCVLRAEGGGGRVEVFGRVGAPSAGFDGNRGLVVRSADGVQFPETRLPR